MADKTQNIKTRLSFDGEAEYKAACKEINSTLILLNVDTGEFIKINVTMQTGDTIEVSTKYGSKGAKLIRDGVETDYFRYVDVDSTYMQLAIGDNNFRYDAESGVNSMEVSIFYNKEYLGV